ncbi:MAG: T9SS type A sorting domain-containing protein [Bacteroidia bacterium]|nr:T9SS type A sorting domain-containing protein [Bacteroidia bacterium]
MKKIFLFFIFFLFFFCSKAQNFVPVPGGIFDYQLQKTIYDSVNNQLLVSSRLLDDINGLYVRGIGSWDGASWDSLGGGLDTHDTLSTTATNALITSCIPYNGKLLVGGQFKSIGGINTSLLALWDGLSWDSLPQRAFEFSTNYADGIVYGLYKHNGLIYIYGNFDSIVGQPTSSIATYDGNSFQPIVLPLDSGSQISIHDAIEFNGELYICGAFDNNPTPGYRSILKFDGSNWLPVGGGLLNLGSGAYLHSMVVYKNELYVAGHFLKADGNTGDNVMKWNGSQWIDAQMNNGFNTVIYKMLVYHEQIWCFGYMDSAGGLSASNIAVLDSTKWCTYANDIFDNIIVSAAIFNDTLYIAGGFWSVNNDSSVSHFAKIQNPDNFSGCIALGINEISSFNSFSIYPNPAQSIINIEFENSISESYTLNIVNVLGETVYSKQMNDPKLQISVDEFPSGIYVVRVQNEKGIWSKKFIRQ